MELPTAAVPGEPHGVWGRIIDPFSNMVLGKPAESWIDVMLLAIHSSQPTADPDWDEWEPWTQPADYEQRVGKRWTWRSPLAEWPNASSRTNWGTIPHKV